MTTLSAEDLALFKNIDFGIAQNAVNSLLATIDELQRERDEYFHRLEVHVGMCHGFVAKIELAEAEVSRLREILGFNGASDAYHNLGGAIIDIQRGAHICDDVCLNTLKRVERQLGEAKAALSPPGGTEE